MAEGLEIVSLNRGKFEKFGDITYVFWELTVISAEILKFAPHVAVKVSYSKDLLLIHRIQLGDVAPTERVSLFAVDSFHRDPDKMRIEELKRMALPDFNSAFLCHYFSIKHPTRELGNFVVVDVKQPDMFKFTIQSNAIITSVHRDFAERLRKQIRERLATF